MAKKRNYDVDKIMSEYEDTLTHQETKQKNSATATTPAASPFDYVPESYQNPDKEDYKRISLFMEFEIWERLQALCWQKNEAVNKVLVDKLSEWSKDVSEETLHQYREAMKQKHLHDWEQERNIIRHWWQTSGLYDKLKVQSYKMNRNSLLVTEENGNVRKYYIHRGWITDGHSKLAKAKDIPLA